MHQHTYRLPARSALLFVLSLTACLEFDSGTVEPDWGKADLNPGSLVGKKMVQTVTANDGQATTMEVGKSITYQFKDASTVLGEGKAKVNTTAWNYKKTGDDTGVLTLTYEQGKTIDYLTFDWGGDSGTYRSEITFTDGQVNSHSGTFVLSELEEGGEAECKKAPQPPAQFDYFCEDAESQTWESIVVYADGLQYNRFYEAKDGSLENTVKVNFRENGYQSIEASMGEVDGSTTRGEGRSASATGAGYSITTQVDNNGVLTYTHEGLGCGLGRSTLTEYQYVGDTKTYDRKTEFNTDEGCPTYETIDAWVSEFSGLDFNLEYILNSVPYQMYLDQ